jgi:plasmid stabilization system protein ParE
VKRYRVIYAPGVGDQIDEQVMFIARDSVANALAWAGRLRAAIGGLSEVSGYAVDDDVSERLGYPVRKFVFERTYLVLFVVDDDAHIVRVVGMRHGARLPREGEA